MNYFIYMLLLTILGCANNEKIGHQNTVQKYELPAPAPIDPDPNDADPDPVV